MAKSICNSLTVQLSPELADEFLTDLNSAGVGYSETLMFNTNPKPVLIQIFESVMDAMPWNTFAKVAIAYIQRNQNNRIKIINADGSSIEAHGLSEKAMQEAIQNQHTETICIYTVSAPTEPLE